MAIIKNRSRSDNFQNRPEMTNESADAHRQALVASGQILPARETISQDERPCMMDEHVKALREKLIKSKIIVPELQPVIIGWRH